MFNSLLFLAIIAKSGGGVGLKSFTDCSGLSKFKARSILKDLIKVGAVICVKRRYQLTLLGACLVVADDAASQGYGVSLVELNKDMPAFQKGF